MPFESLLGPRGMPAEATAIVARAIDKMIASGHRRSVHRGGPVELLCADYLAGE